MNVYLQKYNGTTCEFLEYDLVEGRANPESNLGRLDIQDGMLKSDLISKLRDAANKLEKYQGDVFIVS